MAIPADFTFTSNALTYKYEIYNNSAHRTGLGPISGLLAGDYSSGVNKWDTDPGIGGAANYKIKYYVDLEAASDSAELNLETIDVTFNFNTVAGGQSLFNDFSGASFSAGSAFNYAVSHQKLAGDSVRFTGAVGDKLTTPAGTAFTSSDGWTELFTLNNVTINTNEAVEGLLSGALSSKLGNIALSANTNIYDTVVSEREVSGGSATGDAKIQSLADSGIASETSVDSVDADNYVSLHEAKSQLEDMGTTIYTQRYIGSNEKTFLIRSGDTVSADAFWTNAGTYSESFTDIILSNNASSQLSLDLSSGARFSDYLATDELAARGGEASVLEGLAVDDSARDGSNLEVSTAEGVKLNLDVQLDSSVAAGTTLSDLDFYQAVGANSDNTAGIVDNSLVTANVVTYKGDLNYDGRVSLKDLAFLNAGKIAQTAGGEFSDVDADYNGSIEVADLAVLSSDWNKSIHSAVTKTDLTKGYTTWSAIDASVVNTLAGTGNIDPFSSLNSVDFANTSFETQADVETAHIALGIVGVTGSGLSGGSYGTLDLT